MTIDVGTVGMIPLESVTVDERARKEMGDLDTFESNLKEIGLTSPLTVKDNGDKTYTLLAGERRFRILQRNNISPIPVRIYNRELTDLEMKVVEKSENFHRKDFEYWELDKLTAEIHSMQQEVHGVKRPGPDQEGWDLADTGTLLGGTDKSEVSRSISRAQARDAFPELFNGCKTASDASKVMKKLSEAMVKQTIVEKIAKKKSTSPLLNLANQFVIKNFFEGVKKIPKEIMHLVEIDPPYAIELQKQKKSDGESQYMLEDYNEIDKSVYIDGHPDLRHPWRGMRQTLKDCYRIMSPHSWLICWFAPEPWADPIYEAILEAGFETTRMYGLWSKGSPGQNFNPDIRLSNSYELFYYAWKGQPALNKAGRSNEFRFSPVPPGQKTHPTERPLELMKELYDTFAFPGSRVFIPFLGSGSGLIAAHELGMSPTGFELSQGYKDSFLVRLHQMQS